MSSSVFGLFESVGIPISGVVRWNDSLPTTQKGVYVISNSRNPHVVVGTPPKISDSALESWITRVPAMRIDKMNPTVSLLKSRLEAFWLHDESVLYIGKATSLRKRVGQYYSTPLGCRRPHAGGHWLKTLSNLKNLFVHYSETVEPEAREADLLGIFKDNVSGPSARKLYDPRLPIPFANLEFPRGKRKCHGISKSKLAD